MPRASKTSPAKLGAPVAKKKSRGPNKRKMPEEFPSGEILHDTAKKQWILGPVIGKGGFGLIYLATQPVDKHAAYVVKIEPLGNGPLFCELTFYLRAAKIESVDSWIHERRLKYLGVPKCNGAGRHEMNGKMYRFMVMQRFSTDLQLLFNKSQTFLPQSVMALGLRMVDALEYIHHNEYVHADIKAANMLLGFKGGKMAQDEVYLVDYGLAYRYVVDGKHKAYEEDPRKAHDGTIEFTSRDAHNGVWPSRRGDFEILGYCMLQWLCGRLPWEDKLSDPNYVKESKIKYMRNIPLLLKDCFPGGNHPDAISSYLSLVVKLDYDEKPNYKHLRKILLDGLHKLGCKDEWKLNLPLLGASPTTQVKIKVKSVAKKRKSGDHSDEPCVPKQRKTTSIPASSSELSPKAAARGSPRRRKVSAPAPGSPKRRKVAAPGKTRSPVTSSNGQIDTGTVSCTDRSPDATVRKSRSSTGPKKTTTRRVKRSRKPRMDAAIQTTPGLKRNR